MRLPVILRLPAVATVLVLGLAACGGDEPTVGNGGATATEATGTEAAGEFDTSEFDLVSSGQLTVCTDSPYEPFEFEDPGTESGFTGYDIELMGAIADQFGLDLAVRDIGFDAIQSGTALAANQCDVAASAMTITEEREENVDFSQPYFNADQSLLVKKDSGITELEDLANKTIGVQQATTGAMYARQNAPEGAQIREFDAADALFAALEAGQIDAILQDFPVNLDRAQKDETLEVVQQFPTGEQYGFAVKEEGKEALLDAINQALANLRESSRFSEIFNKYFPGVQPPQS